MNAAISALRKMYNLERFATEIYRTQIAAFTEKEISDRLKIARDNEQEHTDNLKAQIEKLGGRQSRQGFLFQAAGRMLGCFTRMMGKMFILKADIWIETKAVKDYGAFLQRLNFDEESKALVQRNLEDEKVHIKRWEDSAKLLRDKKR
ncbi:MAG: ferritin-like domain-containing protein [Chloroflexi bacterium]|nr:ferritin-like domain-containing protein [Chloroflexota bacterium]